MENNKSFIKLNNLYKSIFGRPVDSAGVESYLSYMDNEDTVIQVTNILFNSEEFKNKNNENSESDFNSLAGDRLSYISSNDVSIIDQSRYSTLLNRLIELILLLDYPYTDLSLQLRKHTVKKSIIHMGKKNIRFTILPHMEYYFNTEKFLTSLKDSKNLQYYIYYICIMNIWKTIFGKTVNTCQTDRFVNKLNNLYSLDKDIKHIVFLDIIDVIGNYITDYISVKIGGKVLNDEGKIKAKEYLEHEDADGFISYIYSFFDNHIKEEDEKISYNINRLINILNRKPKVLIMVAYLETQHEYFLEKMMYHINKVKETNANLDIDFALDNDRINKESTDYTPWSRVKRIRNLMLNKYNIHNYDYLYIIDSDMVDYPHNFLSRAIGLNPEGITAPMALIQNSVTFYDWCGYQKKGATSLNSPYKYNILELSVPERNFKLLPPYVDDHSRLVEIDCVGCTYVVPTKVFSQTYGDLKNELLQVFSLAGVKDHKILENKVQYEDHPSFTDHYTICAAVRANGGKIYMDRGSSAYHADLPIFGENSH